MPTRRPVDAAPGWARAWARTWLTAALVVGVVVVRPAPAAATRVLPPDAARVMRELGRRVAPELRLEDAKIAPDHALVRFSLLARPGEPVSVRLTDALPPCAGRLAGDFCVEVLGAAAPEAEALLLAALASLAADQTQTIWHTLPPAPTAWTPPEAAPPSPPPRTWLTRVLPLLAALAALTLAAWLARRSLRRRLSARPRLAKLALGAVWAAYTLGATELLLRAAFHLVLAPQVEALPTDELRRLAFLDASEHGEQRPRFPNAAVLHDPTRGHRLAPGLRDALALGDTTVSTNSRGLRGDREYLTPKPAGVTRVLAVGDSFTFGQGVRDPEAWPARLEALLPESEVLNAGAACYAHDQILATLQEEGAFYRPDIVVLGFFAADVERNAHRFVCYEKPHFVSTETGYALTNSPVPTPDALRAELRWTSMLGITLRAALRGPPDVPARVAVTHHILGEIARATAALGAHLVVAYLPAYREFQDSDDRRVWVDFCARSGADCVDLTGDMNPRLDAGYVVLPDALFLDDGGRHYSPLGNRRVAERLAAHLAARAARR